MGLQTNPIEFKYKKLRLAQDLNKATLSQVAMKLLKEKNGSYEMPQEAEIIAYLNGLAKKSLIKHYVLNGEHCQIVLFDNEEVVSSLNIMEIEARKTTEVVKIQCYDKQVSHQDSVPIEISTIDELYRIPKTTFNSGTCVYFLCRDGKVVYIGQAENVHTRITEHQKDKLFDDVYYIRVAMNKMSKVESALIAFLKPEYNKTSLALTNHKEALAKSVLKSNGLNFEAVLNNGQEKKERV